MLKGIFRNAFPRPIWVLLGKLKIEIKVALAHYGGVPRARRIAHTHNLKLNLACGHKPKPGWINVDFTPEADFALDLRQSLPFPNDSCSMIYSEHFLEHIEYPLEAEFFLREAFRVLTAEGEISLGVPDTEQTIAAYMEGEEAKYFQLINKWGFHPQWCTTRMEHLNCHFRHSGHLFAYDYETLHVALQRCGFVRIQRRPFDAALDSLDREELTLYVKAHKPEKGGEASD